MTGKFENRQTSYAVQTNVACEQPLAVATNDCQIRTVEEIIDAANQASFSESGSASGEKL